MTWLITMKPNLLKITSVILLYFLLGCQHLKPPRPASLSLKSVDNQAEVSFEPTSHIVAAEGRTLWYSAFSVADAQEAERVLNRRKYLFLQLFKDDHDPYTKTVTRREQCLSKVESSEIDFNSGAPPAWSACGKNKVPMPLKRKWIHCGSYLWEVTFDPMISGSGPQCN